MTKEDFVLISFPFTDYSNEKLRPAVVVWSNETDIIAIFLTSQLRWQESTDLLLKPTITNGLKKESLVRTSKIATLDRKLVKGKLGNLTFNQIVSLNKNLSTIFDLKSWFVA